MSDFDQLKSKFAIKGFPEYWKIRSFTNTQLKIVVKLCYQKKKGSQILGGGHLLKNENVLLGVLTSILELQESVDALLRTAENELRESEKEHKKEERVLNDLCGTGSSTGTNRDPKTVPTYENSTSRTSVRYPK